MIKIGTSGFRGIDGKNFDSNVVKIIAQATSDIIKKHKYKKEVFVGFDKRKHSRLYAHDICRVLVANKIKTFLCPYAEPSPLLSFAGKIRKNDLTLMVTASHNEYAYNGIKIFGRGGSDLSSEIEIEFDTLVQQMDLSKVKIISWQQCQNNPLFALKNIEEEYVSSIISQIAYNPNGGNFLFETMGGSSAHTAKLLAKKMKGVHIYVNNIESAHNTPILAPIPTKENLTHLKGLINKLGCRFAFATDGDGDRLAVVTPDGKYHDGTEIATLIYYFAIKYKNENGGFVGNQSYSLLARYLCNKLDKNYYESRVGYKFIAQSMNENNVNFGSENSSLCVKTHTPFKDGLLAFALLIEVVCHKDFENKSLNEIIADIKEFCKYHMEYIEKSFKFDANTSHEEILAKMDSFVPHIAGLKTRQNLDGNIKYIFENDCWAMLRLSGTENSIRIISEQPSEEENNKLINNIISQFERYAGIKVKK